MDHLFKNIHVDVFFSVFVFFTVLLHTAPSWQPEVLLQTLRKNSDKTQINKYKQESPAASVVHVS